MRKSSEDLDDLVFGVFGKMYLMIFYKVFFVVECVFLEKCR